ncbi:MAG: hypothetical protein RR636_01605 [Clostridium sp.]|uniref:hypothetical protein n=1 Tax=Clostridium sp. TaxID=1506 RepID=UPI003033CB7E
MEISLNLIEESVKSNSIEDVRKALIEYIRVEPENSEKLINALNYAKENVDGLFEIHDNIKLEEDNLWTKEYFLKTLKDLSNNFSEERFNHLCLVGAFIYPNTEAVCQDTVIINNVKPVSDSELRFEKVKTMLALGSGILVGFIIGKKLGRKK